MSTLNFNETSPAESLRRVDLYSDVHKALRHALLWELDAVGRLDVADDVSVERVMDGLAVTLAGFGMHADHEDVVVHPLIEAAEPGAASRADEDHRRHRAELSELLDIARLLPRTPRDERPTRRDRLYRHLALFAAENLTHMHLEETAHNAILWRHYSDEELIAARGDIVARIPPQALAWFYGRFAAALPLPDLRAMFGAMRDAMPAAAFGPLFDAARAARPDLTLETALRSAA